MTKKERYDKLMQSFYRHRGQDVSEIELNKLVKPFIDKLSGLKFKECMVCYDDEDHIIDYDILSKKENVFHFRQYLSDGDDKFTYCIEKDRKFIAAGMDCIEHIPNIYF